MKLKVIFFVCSILGAAPIASNAANNALSFDGVNDYVTFGSASARLGASNFTIEVWFRRTGAGVSTSTGIDGITAVPLLAKGRAEGERSKRDINYFLGIRPSDNVLVADFEEGANGTTPGLNHPITGVTTISNHVWHHAAATYDGATWRLYLNGALERELPVNHPVRANSIQHASLATALNSSGVPRGFFRGSLDEARIWNYARSGAEIASSKNLEIASQTGLIGRWGMNGSGGTRIYDSSGNGATGTLRNGPRRTAGFQASITRGPYLQLGTPHSMVIRWRTDVATDSRVQVGGTPDALALTFEDARVTTEHEVALTGLEPDTQYYYAVGSTTATLAGGNTNYYFITSPPNGMPVPTRIWVLGDAGTRTASQRAVRDAFYSANAGRHTDLWLMLGDNAYDRGTDAEFQGAVFNMYPQTLRTSVLWPTLGNHDTASSTSFVDTYPYFRMFTLPRNGEAGGVASGTEHYYSFDFGNVHFICLDSQTANRSTNGPMAIWAAADIAATTAEWIIAFWHHPPYSKGSHDSDVETQLVQMRRNLLPILEAGGVDLVLSGHSHSYERSFLIDGHYGTAGTLTSAMIRDGGSGRDPTPYTKPDGNGGRQGTVYAVAGASGRISGGALNHPAMYMSLNVLGSLVIDVMTNRMDVSYLDNLGAVRDTFVIQK
jgi:hypothetical protein